MVLRLVLFLALGVDAVINQQLLTAVFAFGTPFGGPIGVYLATITAILFAFSGRFVEASLAGGYLLFTLAGNKVLEKHSSNV